MKPSYRCLLLITALFAPVAHAQWVPTNGPCGVGITTLAVGSSESGEPILFAGGAGPVFVSTNKGARWYAQSTGLPGSTFSSIALCDGNVFAAGPAIGVYISTDKGRSWQPANSGLPSVSDVITLGVSGTTLFVATELHQKYSSQGAVYRSTDRGVHWAIVDLPERTYVRSIVGTGDSIFVATLGAGVYLSTDNGVSWRTKNYGLPSGVVRALAVKGSLMFASCEGLYRSTNSGESWTSIDSTFRAGVFAFLGDTLVAAYQDSADGVFLCADDPINRIRVRTGVMDVRTFAASGTDLLAAGYYGVSISNDRGATWCPINAGLPGIYAVHDFAVAGDHLLVADGGVHVTTDNGESWTYGLGSTYVETFTNIGSNVLAGGQSGMMLSTDQGTTWTTIPDVFPGEFPEVHDFLCRGPLIFASTGHYGIYCSRDDGTVWVPCNIGLPMGSVGYPSVYPLVAIGNNLFAGTFYGVYRSTDNGAVWTQTAQGLPLQFVPLLQENASMLFAGNFSGFYVSTDSGSTWKIACSDIMGAISMATSGSNVFVGTRDQGVYQSPDNGLTWTAVSSGLPTAGDVTALGISNGHLFAGTQSGIFRRPLSEFGILLPVSPSLNWPPNGATTDTTDSRLSWTKTANASFYRLQVSTDSTFRTMLQCDLTLSDSCVTISQFRPSTTYYWHVCAMNTGGTSAYSQVWKFETRVAFPEPVALLFPLENAAVGKDSVRFFWRSTSPGVEHYRWQLAMDSLFSNPMIDSTLADTSKVVHALTGGATYWWKVAAENSAGWGTFSATRRFTTLLTGVDEEESTPVEFSLAQNYPNPFNPRTVVSSQLPVASNVRIVIYDLLGRELAVLVNERRADGHYEDIFDGSGLSSGTYICRMTAGAFVQSQKMLLVK